MKNLLKDVENQARDNTFFRQVLLTSQHTQVVIMSIPAGGEIGSEVHPDNDQVLFCVEGEGKVVAYDEEAPFEKGDLVLIEAGIKHNFINTGQQEMKIVTTYSPPHHPQGTIHKTKQEADNAGY